MLNQDRGAKSVGQFRGKRFRGANGASSGTLTHYLIIYFMILFCQSCAYSAYLSNLVVELLVIAGFGAYLVIKDPPWSVYAFGFLLVDLIIVISNRLLTGGTGLGPWADYSSFVIVAFVAVAYCPHKFVERFLKVMVSLAAISLFCYAVQLLSPNLLLKLLPFRYDIGWTIGEWSNLYNQSMFSTVYVNGLLLYSFRSFDPMRNVGIFSEPANYQIVLNIAICLILFSRRCEGMPQNKKLGYLIVLILAVFSSGSTSGYLVLIAQLLVYLVFSQDCDDSNIRRSILLIGVISIAALIGDYVVRGADSYLQQALISKIIGNTGSIDLSANTGRARIGTIQLGTSVMLDHPAGVGHEAFLKLRTLDGMAGGGGGLFALGAAEGVFAFLFIPFWTYLPLAMSNERPLARILLIAVMLYCSLAQTYAITPIYAALTALSLMDSTMSWSGVDRAKCEVNQ